MKYYTVKFKQGFRLIHNASRIEAESACEAMEFVIIQSAVDPGGYTVAVSTGRSVSTDGYSVYFNVIVGQ